MPRLFPFEPARDLVGILRSVYVHERSKPRPDGRKLRRIERLATELTAAMTSAEQHDLGTAPYERALSRADGAAFRLADVVQVYDPLEPVLKAAGDRVRGKRGELTMRQLRATGKVR
ncbi:MAG TPA: hypothetical protein VH062_19410 [Polyangiaceae bacterium]|nr:hypothetical protein [Polyangiaceae bacterium]